LGGGNPRPAGRAHFPFRAPAFPGDRGVPSQGLIDYSESRCQFGLFRDEGFVEFDVFSQRFGFHGACAYQAAGDSATCFLPVGMLVTYEGG
jgi:hypothetical protein